MSYSPKEIRNYLGTCMSEARDMLQQAIDELDDVEQTICDMEGNL